MKYLTYRFFSCLALLLILFCFQLGAQTTNPCGVKASIWPASADSVVAVNTIIPFTSTSTNASSVTWLYDGIPSGVTGPLWNYQITAGIHRLGLVAYNGNCSDTTTVVYFSAGTPHNIDSLLVANYGTYTYNEEGTCIDKTADGGFIVGGVQYLYNPYCGEAGIVVKLRDKGCIDWSKKFIQPYFCTSTKVTAINASADGSYYVATNNIELAKLDNNGNLLWNKQYHLTGSPISVSNIYTDPQGAVYTISSAYNNGWMITRLDKNGAVTWNKFFRLSIVRPNESPFTEFAIPSGMVWLKGKLYICGNAHTNSDQAYFSFITRLDALTGNREWQYGYQDPEFPGAVGFTHLALYDTLLMASSGAQGHMVTLIDQQGLVRKSVKTKFGSSYAPKVTRAGADSKGHIYMMQWTEESLSLQPYYWYATNFAEIDTSLNKYGGLVHAQYSRGYFADATMGLNNQFAAVGQDFSFVDDGAYASRDIRFLKADTLSAQESCFNTDETYSVLEKTINRINFQYQIDSSLTIVEADATIINAVDAYIQSRYSCPDFLDSCSFMKISGPLNLCSLSDTYTYRMHRNQKCVLAPQWQIPAGINIIHQTDSSITLKFPAFGTYKMYGSLNGCIPVKDSLTINIFSKTHPLALGNDTTICNGTSISLHAGPEYLLYTWNDGSSDSMLTATQPGIYWVEVADSCGNKLRDSLTISPFNLAINIGPDRIKCNNDTLHLDAPAGFLNYEWSNNYNLSSTQSQQVIVNPWVDTAYYLKAEKLPGCFAFDTVRIDVKTSPAVQLGPDKSFCKGDSALIRSGVGFIQYQWSNGSTTPKIAVYEPGNYSLVATTAEGCKSYDTLRIVNVWANPMVNLDNNPDLCTGSTRTLEAGNFVSYTWQDGSTSPSFTVSSTGTYHVTVTDDHQCIGSDTVHILRILPLPANFLNADTAICNYGNLLLTPTRSFNNYTWSNNATSATITITVPGIYWLRATDANSCTGLDSIIVGQKECLTGFFIPTGFTPDGNGRNDYFKPIIGGLVKQYQFTIYNRWGQAIFATKDLHAGWDGMYKGTAMETNVFAWSCTYQLEGGAVKNERGSVVLIR